MPAGAVLEPRIGNYTEIESDTKVHMGGACGAKHIHNKAGDLCGGTCDLEFSHNESHECGTCGEAF